MEYDNRNEVSTMWYEKSAYKSMSGLHKINFNVLKSIKLNVGDIVFFGIGDLSNKYWVIKEIKNERQSALKDYNYVETMCEFLIKK